MNAPALPTVLELDEQIAQAELKCAELEQQRRLVASALEHHELLVAELRAKRIAFAEPIARAQDVVAVYRLAERDCHEASRVYSAARAALAEQLGVEPSRQAWHSARTLARKAWHRVVGFLGTLQDGSDELAAMLERYPDKSWVSRGSACCEWADGREHMGRTHWSCPLHGKREVGSFGRLGAARSL